MERINEHYKDFYGCTGRLATTPAGKIRMTIRTAQGKLVVQKDYSTRKGARIAMGMFGDCWHRTA